MRNIQPLESYRNSEGTVAHRWFNDKSVIDEETGEPIRSYAKEQVEKFVKIKGITITREWLVSNFQFPYSESTLLRYARDMGWFPKGR